MSTPTGDDSVLRLPPELVRRFREFAAAQNRSAEDLAAETLSTVLADGDLLKDIEKARASVAAGRTVKYDDAKEYLRKLAQGLPAEKPRWS
ncbi:MAG: hypothetical protein AB2A00_22940 [Myxococcota bacterium]